MPEPLSCSLYRLGTSNGSNRAIVKSAQRLWHTSAAAAPVTNAPHKPPVPASWRYIRRTEVQICHALNGRVSLFYRDTHLEHSNLTQGDIFTLLQQAALGELQKSGIVHRLAC